MSSGSIRSARVNALAVLIVGYVALTFAWTHHQRLSLLWEARLVLAERLINGPLRVEREFWDQAAKAERKRLIPGVGEASYTVNETEDRGRVHRVVVTKRLGAGWAVSFRVNDSGEERIVARADRDLHELAAEIGIFASDEADEVSTYQQIENSLLGAQVNVPGTGLGFQGTTVVWACAVVTVFLLLVTRNRVDHALRQPTGSASEQWLLVDGHRGLERVVAGGWAAGLLLMPWLTSGALIMASSSQLYADGAASGLPEDIVATATLLSILLVNGWLSLTTVDRILALRAIRKKEIAGQAQSISSSSMSKTSIPAG